MANYVSNKVICSKDVLYKYFIDFNPFNDEVPLNEPYITFNKLFGVKSLNEYSEKYGVIIYYGFSFSYKERPDGLYEVKFCTRWKYPILAIIRLLELSHEVQWYAVEENCIYVSKFYWKNGVKEDVKKLELVKEYEDWREKNKDFEDTLEDWDDWVWYYLEDSKTNWINWESSDNFDRYLDKSVYNVNLPFK